MIHCRYQVIAFQAKLNPSWQDKCCHLGSYVFPNSQILVIVTAEFIFSLSLIPWKNQGHSPASDPFIKNCISPGFTQLRTLLPGNLAYKINLSYISITNIQLHENSGSRTPFGQHGQTKGPGCYPASFPTDNRSLPRHSRCL